MIRRRYYPLLAMAVILLTLGAAGCQQLSRVRSGGVTVAAPDYLRPVLDKAADQFKRENNITVRITYLAPDKVVDQARRDRNIDAFIAADQGRFKDRVLRDSVMLDGLYSCPFRLSLLLIGRADGPQAGDISDLDGEQFQRVAVMAPESGCVGQAAKIVLERKHLWKKIQGKLVVAETPSRLMSFLQTGEVDAAIVLELSVPSERKLVVMQKLDGDRLLDRYLLHCGAVTRSSQRQESAQAFLDLLDSQLCDIYSIKGVTQNTD